MSLVLGLFLEVARKYCLKNTELLKNSRYIKIQFQKQLGLDLTKKKLKNETKLGKFLKEGTHISEEIRKVVRLCS